MDTAQIQKIITDQFADPQSAKDLQKLLKEVAKRQGAQPDALELAHGSSFIYNYLEQVPYLLTVAWTSARNVGLETEVTSILKMVESYWIEDDDVRLLRHITDLRMGCSERCAVGLIGRNVSAASARQFTPRAP